MLIRFLLLFCCIFYCFGLFADDKKNEQSLLCPDAKLWSDVLIKDVCWSCLLPINIMGIQDGAKIPADANTKPFCTCIAGDDLKTIEVGVSIGFWEPYRLVEVVRTPYCFPALGGKIIKKSVALGNGKSLSTKGTTGKVFYHYHWFSFALLQILELISGKCTDGFSGLDLMYMSEVDPTWNEDELAFFTNPEVVLFANPTMKAACLADCAAATANKPIKKLFWCAGCWGSLYPFSGNISTVSSPPRESSLIMTRALASLHRRGLVRRHVGEKNRCEGKIAPMLPKTDYKISMLFPISESTHPCCHNIGANTFKWGEWRNIPARGEDFVYLLWRYNDCCFR